MFYLVLIRHIYDSMWVGAGRRHKGQGTGGIDVGRREGRGGDRRIRDAGRDGAGLVPGPDERGPEVAPVRRDLRRAVLAVDDLASPNRIGARPAPK